MSTISKKWLQQKIADMEATRDDIPFGLGEDGTNTLAALRIALASLEAEPVCVIDQSNLDYLKSGSDADVWPASRTEMGDVLLYRTAPPSPVSVPDESAVELLATDLMKRIDKITGERHSVATLSSLRVSIVEACRAAMLQGAEPAKGWIPCSDRMPDTMISVLVTGDWFHHAVSFWDGASWCDLDFEPPVTHWMPLPAAPQQEA